MLKGVGSHQSDISESAIGIVARLDNVINGLANKRDTAAASLERLAQEEIELAAEAEKPYKFEAELAELRQSLRDVNRELGMI